MDNFFPEVSVLVAPLGLLSVNRAWAPFLLGPQCPGGRDLPTVPRALLVPFLKPERAKLHGSRLKSTPLTLGEPLDE